MFQLPPHLEVFRPCAFACAHRGEQRWMCAIVARLRNRPEMRSGNNVSISGALLLWLHHCQFLSSGWAQVLRNRPSSPLSASKDVKMRIYSCPFVGTEGDITPEQVFMDTFGSFMHVYSRNLVYSVMIVMWQ